MNKQFFLNLRESIRRADEVKDLELCLNKLAISMGDEEVIDQIKTEIYELARSSKNGHKNSINGVDGVTLLDPITSLHDAGVRLSSKYLAKLFIVKTQRLNKTYVHGAFIPKPPSLIEED